MTTHSISRRRTSEAVPSRTVNPTRLLQLYGVVSTIALVVVMLLLSWGMGKIFESYHKRTTERMSVNIGYTLFQLERDVFLQRDNGQMRLRILPEDFASFDQRMRGFLAPMDILKIVIFSPEKRIIYSTDHTVIGQVDDNNENLNRSLAGRITSNLEEGETLADLGNELRFDVDLVETYLPLLDSDNNILGAFEVYLDITSYRSEIKRTIQFSLAVVGVLLLLTFSILFILMYQGARQLNKVQDNLEQMASADALTGLWNRRHLEAQLLDAFTRTRQEGKESYYQAGLIMIDLDLFKQINDQHGHLVGDEILITLGQRLKGAVRDLDVVGRYGGEEFLVVLPDANPEQTRASAERIWQAIRSTPMTVDGERYQITASIGVTCIAKDDKTVWDALNRADEALYKAKREGRDRVSLMPPPSGQCGS